MQPKQRATVAALAQRDAHVLPVLLDVVRLTQVRGVAHAAGQLLHSGQALALPVVELVQHADSCSHAARREPAGNGLHTVFTQSLHWINQADISCRASSARVSQESVANAEAPVRPSPWEFPLCQRTSLRCRPLS